MGEGAAAGDFDKDLACAYFRRSLLAGSTGRRCVV
jgi:hypothetical protein